MGHFDAQAARPGPEPGRAGRKTIIVSSDLSERIDYNIPGLPIYATCVVVDPELLERLGADERVFVGELLHQCVPTAARRHSAHLA